MAQALENLAVADGDPVRKEHIAIALTAGSFGYDDGATQTFQPGGGTTYVEHERRSHGEWYVDSEGRFCSFWPPSYRACYDLHCIVENGSVVGLRFTELDRGSVSLGVTGDTTLAVTYCCYRCPGLDAVPKHSSRHTSDLLSFLLMACVAHVEESDDFVD